jgi:hypothetical protein
VGGGRPKPIPADRAHRGSGSGQPVWVLVGRGVGRRGTEHIEQDLRGGLVPIGGGDSGTGDFSGPDEPGAEGVFEGSPIAPGSLPGEPGEIFGQLEGAGIGHWRSSSSDAAWLSSVGRAQRGRRHGQRTTRDPEAQGRQITQGARIGLPSIPLNRRLAPIPRGTTAWKRRALVGWAPQSTVAARRFGIRMPPRRSPTSPCSPTIPGRPGRRPWCPSSVCRGRSCRR